MEQHGVLVSDPFCLDSGGTAPLFADGLVLARLVATLSRGSAAAAHGGQLATINKSPSSRAACLFNIQKVLSVLRDNPAMPISYLYSADRILAGDAAIILGLLKDIQTAYAETDFRGSGLF
jgi:hypothetical protein